MNYYLFATYVFFLVCIVVIISKFFFADVRRQRKLLEEKEKQLLDTYRTLEDAMDEYYVIVEESKKDIKELVSDTAVDLYDRAGDTAPMSASYVTVSPLLATEQDRVLRNTRRNSGPIAFDQLYSNAVISSEEAAVPVLHEKILALAGRGNSRADIAKKLQITQNEVKLVLGMYGASSEETEDEGGEEAIGAGS